jgi:hypothetical protein
MRLVRSAVVQVISYEVETDAFGDGGMGHWVDAMA